MENADGLGTAVVRTSTARRMEAPSQVARSLGRQALLVAVACLLVDAVAFAGATPDMPAASRAGALVAVVCVDAALGLPARCTGWVTAVHAVTAVGLAAVLHATAGADLDLIGGMIAAYRAGAWLRNRASVGGVLALAAGSALAQSVTDPGNALATVTEMIKDACIPWMVGRYTTARRAYISELRHNRENELRDAAVEMEKAVNRVRTSIARDLHDVISHHVSAIGVHSGAARIRLAAKPGFTGPEIMDSLTAVELSTRSAMSDLRRMLDILHGAAESTNQPGLDNLDELFDGVRRSGLATRFTVSGVPRGLPGSVDVALYRITQEMLTNALRYGDGGAVDVELDFGEAGIVLATRNGIGDRAERGDRPSTGRGLAGIRSRAALFGGTVSHGPDPGGKNWETRVSVSYGTSSPGEAL